MPVAPLPGPRLRGFSVALLAAALAALVLASCDTVVPGSSEPETEAGSTADTSSALRTVPVPTGGRLLPPEALANGREIISDDGLRSAAKTGTGAAIVRRAYCRLPAAAQGTKAGKKSLSGIME